MSGVPPRAGAVGRRLDRFVADGWMPGGCWWIEGPRGVVDRGAVGNAALEPRIEPARETIAYDLASLTKPLATALVAVLLEQRGRVALDAPVSSMLPELTGTAYRERTLLDLGTHRAGLPAWQPVYLRARSLADYVREIGGIAPAPDPGVTVYSDLGYILLGAALERATGTPLLRLFHDLVAGPLELRESGFAAGTERFASAAPTERGNRYERELAGAAGRGHAWRSDVLRGEVHDANAHALGGAAGHAGLFGTLEEVARIAREILRPQRLGLSDPARARLLESVTGAPDGRTFGMVLAADSEAARGVLSDGAPGHTGFTGTSLWFEPGRDAFYVLLTNRVHPVVQARGFQPVRREFHRLARALV